MDTVESDEMGCIHCPHCGEWNLHPLRIEIDFKKEDEYDTPQFVVKHSPRPNAIIGVTEQHVIKGDTGRRECIRITFTCENCDEESTLELKQHKGPTYMHWFKDQKAAAAQ